MSAERMTNFSAAYEDVARLFHALGAGAGGTQVVPHPVAQDQIEVAERALGAALPHSFRLFQLEFGDCQHAPFDIYSALPAEAPGLNLVTINVKARTALVPCLPAYLIAFSDDGGGNYYCFDTRAVGESEAPVVVWDHELSEDQSPEPIALSFVEWLRRELEERLAEEQEFRQEWQANAINAFARDLLNKFRGGRG
jgi:SMI1-KNR4 cell-wall